LNAFNPNFDHLSSIQKLSTYSPEDGNLKISMGGIYVIDLK